MQWTILYDIIHQYFRWYHSVLNRAPDVLIWPCMAGLTLLEVKEFTTKRRWHTARDIRHVTSFDFRFDVLSTDTNEKKHNVMQLNLFNLALRTPYDLTECVATYSSRTQPPIICLPQLQPSYSAALVPKLCPWSQGWRFRSDLRQRSSLISFL